MQGQGSTQTLSDGILSLALEGPTTGREAVGKPVNQVSLYEGQLHIGTPRHEAESSTLSLVPNHPQLTTMEPVARSVRPTPVHHLAPDVCCYMRKPAAAAVRLSSIKATWRQETRLMV